MEEPKNIKGRLSLRVVILLLGCVHVATPKFRGREPLKQEERKKFLAGHNNYRKDATKEFDGITQPPAANMRRMYWNAGLEAEAIGWSLVMARDSNLDHGDTKVKTLPEVMNMFGTTEKDGFGQNIAVGPEDPRITVLLWYNETRYYTLKTDTCLPKKECGHYTQVMWAHTTYVGCGVGQNEGKGMYSACDYFIPGNMVGKPPYIEGENCSLCNTQTKGDFTSCEGGLCQPKDKCSPVKECKVVDMENCLCSEADYNTIVSRLLKADGLRLAPSSLLLLLSVVGGGLFISPLDIA